MSIYQNSRTTDTGATGVENVSASASTYLGVSLHDRLGLGDAPAAYGVSGGKRARRLHHKTSPEDRAKLRSYWKAAIRAAEGLVHLAERHDTEMFGRAIQLQRAVEQLWKLRSHREQNWVGILDQVRTALESLAADEIETATPSQCRLLKELVEVYLSPATKTAEDLTEAVRLVGELGANPFKGLEPLGDV
jgi:hypothetical protein